jgi:hypothetical protein
LATTARGGLSPGWHGKFAVDAVGEEERNGVRELGQAEVEVQTCGNDERHLNVLLHDRLFPEPALLFCLSGFLACGLV